MTNRKEESSEKGTDQLRSSEKRKAEKRKIKTKEFLQDQ